MNLAAEGVIKFQLDFTCGPSVPDLDAADGQGHVNVRIILELLTVAAVADKSDHGAIAVIAGSTP